MAYKIIWSFNGRTRYVGFVDTPGRPYWPGIALPPLDKLRHVPLHSAHNRGVYQINMPLCHHLHQVPVAQFVGYLPADTEHDDLTVKMTTFAQCRSILE